MPIISIINQKGGVGKSTLALQLSAALNKLKEKTLLIDMDPQGHLSLGLGIEKNNLKKSIFNVLDVRYENGMGLADVTIKVNDYLDLIPSNIELSTLELILANRHGRESRLSNALNPQLTSQYDYIIIDCPPNLGMLTINALLASEYVIVPFDTSAFSIDGINYLNSTLQMLSNKINHKVDICYVLNNYDARVQKNKNYYKNIRNKLDKKVFQTIIRKSSYYEEAIRDGVSVFNIKGADEARKDINDFTQEVMEWVEKPIKFLRKSEMNETVLSNDYEEVVFQLKNPYAQDIKITGSFNNWVQNECPLKKVNEDGTWEAKLILPKGRHAYKYIVDGQWQEDYTNPLKEEVHYGVYNSIIEI